MCAHLSWHARTDPGCTARDASSSGDLGGPCCCAPNPVGECRYRPCTSATGVAGRSCRDAQPRIAHEAGLTRRKRSGYLQLVRAGQQNSLHLRFQDCRTSRFCARTTCMRALRMRAPGRTSQSKRQFCTWSALCGRGCGSGSLLSVVRAVPPPCNFCRNLVKKGRIAIFMARLGPQSGQNRHRRLNERSGVPLLHSRLWLQGPVSSCSQLSLVRNAA